MGTTKRDEAAVLRLACLLLFIAFPLTSYAAGPDLLELSSDTSGTVGNPDDTVSITARAINGQGLFISQFGQPGFLQYVSRTADYVTSDNEVILVAYRCVSPGTGIPFRMSIRSEGVLVKEITTYVSCTDQYAGAGLTEAASDISGRVGSDEDLVSIRARATNAEGMRMTQYGEPGFLQFASHSTDSITSDSQTVEIKYKCMMQGTGIPLRIMLIGWDKAVTLTKYVTCSLQDMKLTAVDSDTRGLVGSSEDTVWIKARASNARGVSVSQWGDPSYLSYISHSAESVSGDDQTIQTTYRCIAPGQNILLKIMLRFNGFVIKEATAYVTCTIPNTRLLETGSKLVGIPGSTDDAVWIRARAINADGLRISQFGEPDRLAYVTRSASRITGDDQEFTVVYRCIAPGNNIPFRVSLYNGETFVRELTRYVTCNEVNNPPQMTITEYKQTGTVGTSDDLVWLKVRATNAEGMTIEQYGEPGYLSFSSRSASIVSSNDQEYVIIYRCIAPGSGLELRTWIANGAGFVDVSRRVTCNSGS